MTPMFRRLAALLFLCAAAPLGAQDYKTSFSGIRVDRGQSPSTFHGGVSVDPASGGLNVSIPAGPGIGLRGLHFTPLLSGRWSPQWRGVAEPQVYNGVLQPDPYGSYVYNATRISSSGGFTPFMGGLQLVMVQDPGIGSDGRSYSPPSQDDDTVASIGFPDGSTESVRTAMPPSGTIPSGAALTNLLQAFGYGQWTVASDLHERFQEHTGQPAIPPFVHLASDGDLVIGLVNPALGSAGNPSWLYNTIARGAPTSAAQGYQGTAPTDDMFYAPPKVLVIRGETAYEFTFVTGYFTAPTIVNPGSPVSGYPSVTANGSAYFLIGGEYHLTKMVNRYGDAIQITESPSALAPTQVTAAWVGGDGVTGPSIQISTPSGSLTTTDISYSGGNEAFHYTASRVSLAYPEEQGNKGWPQRPILSRLDYFGILTNVPTGEAVTFGYADIASPGVVGGVLVSPSITTLSSVAFPGRTVTAAWGIHAFCYENDFFLLHSLAADSNYMLTSNFLPHWAGGVTSLTETDSATGTARQEFHTRQVPQMSLTWASTGPKWTSRNFYDAITHPDGSVTVMVYVQPPSETFSGSTTYANDAAHMRRMAYLKHQLQSVWSYAAPAVGDSNDPATLASNAITDVLAHLTAPASSLAYKITFSDRWDLHSLANPTAAFAESAEAHPTRSRTWEKEKGTVVFQETTGWDVTNRGYTTTTDIVATDTSSLATTDYLAVDFPASGVTLSAPAGVLHKRSTVRTLGSAADQWYFGRTLNEASTIITDATGGLAPGQALPYAAAPLARSYEDQFNRVTAISHGTTGDYQTTATFAFGAAGVAQAQMIQATLTGTSPSGALTNSGLVGAGYHYDSNGLMDQISPKGVAWKYSQVQDAFGVVQSQTDPNGKVTNFTWDNGGRLTRIDPPDGMADTVITPDADNLGMVITRGSQASRMRFNGFGELVLEQRSLDGGSTWSSHKAYAYDPAGRRVGETIWLSGAGVETEWMKPNLTGQTVVTIVAQPGYWDSTCLYEDANGNCISRSVSFWVPPVYGEQTLNALYKGTFTDYDLLGRVAQVQAPKDPNDASDLALITNTSYAGPLGSGKSSHTVTIGASATTFTSDAIGRLLTVSDALGQVTTYGYDPAGRIARVTQTDGVGHSQVRTWSYTKTGWVTAMGQPESGTTQYSNGGYTVTGKAKTAVYGYGSATPRSLTTTWDALDRATRITAGDASVDQAFTWDGGTASNFSNGKLLYGRDRGIELNYTYGGMGGALSALSTKTWSGGAVNSGTATTFAQSFTTDTYGNRSGGNTSHAAWTQAFDNAKGMPSVLYQGATVVATASYDTTAWTLSQIAFGNGVKTTYAYMADQTRLKQMTHLPVSGTAFAAWTYSYDDRGNLVTETDTTSGKQDKYGYDLLNRLNFVDANANLSGAWQEYQQSFEYDAFGNRTYGSTARVVSWDTTQSPAKASLAYDSLPAQSQNVSFKGTYAEGAILATNNRIPTKTADGVLTGAAYDALGNLNTIWTVKGDPSKQVTLTYDALGRVTQLTRPGNLIETYAYTPEGLRTVIQTYNGNTLQSTAFNVYDDTRHLVAEYTQAPAGSLTWKKDILYLGGKEAAEWDATGMHITQDDHLGSPRFLSNASGVLESTQKFLPFGESVADAVNAAKFAKGFTNHEQTDASGLIYMQARFYLPWVGRFGSPDPARDQHFEQTQSWNIYSYVQNSPTMNIDPDGEATKDAVKQAAVSMIPVVGGASMVRNAWKGTVSVGGTEVALSTGARWLNGTVGAVTAVTDVVTLGTDDELSGPLRALVATGTTATTLSNLNDAGALLQQGKGKTDAKTDGKEGEEKKEKAKDRREREQAESREKKHGDKDWKEPESDKKGKHEAKEIEREHGKDARRQFHDQKGAGEGDRSKEQLREDRIHIK